MLFLEIIFEELDVWIEEVNIFLSVRFSFEEFERILVLFVDYKIDFGVVMFFILGEFEVDLMIGDDDFEK